MHLLDIRNLSIELDTPHGWLVAVEKFSLTLQEGEIHGLVGESGSGKSLLAQAIMGITDKRTRIIADRLSWRGQDLLTMSVKKRRQLMGRDIAMIFQEPASCLDPGSRVGGQLIEAMPTPEGVPWWRRNRARKEHAIKLLHRVGVKDHQRVMRAFPWELSEGLAQKVMIAMAVSHRPKLLIADEPTTGLETATAAQIYRLLSQLNQTKSVAILLISHNLNSVARWSHNLSVLYCGQMMESGSVKTLIKDPFHPYTKALLASTPSANMSLLPKHHLDTLDGMIPPLQHLPIGCRLGPRCPYARKECVNPPRIATKSGHAYRCHFPLSQEEDAQ
ncbi:MULTISPECIES: oligopeptide/dipeptide ABC transporter ATP-binding protein [Ferrimonas]|uniref:oligopeptide/dipeptide ABC transporter ATP-binding protein n=1 Tax=Ferrimonas TaxID=44011 RepID=UPI0004287308|nr:MULTISPECIES: oligopeptide/dipeptide ABC transporter ATP-binding protein [Ferrimonas]USD38560.1 ATP-binding cassette domain-containing protein [Ferrimonas sp. SCSIO 43195]